MVTNAILRLKIDDVTVKELILEATDDTLVALQDAAYRAWKDGLIDEADYRQVVMAAGVRRYSEVDDERAGRLARRGIAISPVSPDW